MKRRMTKATRAELTDAIRGRYGAAAGKDKRPDLGGVHRRDGLSAEVAIRVLNSSAAPERRQTRQRTSLYDEAARAALIVLWEASDRVVAND
jgi:hypothetical protein